jgi:hypothetical protein
MKRLGYRVAAVVCVAAGALLFAAPVLAGENDATIASMPQEKFDLIEQNVVLALSSGIPGMQADAAQLVRDLKSIRPEEALTQTVVPLMGVLKDEQADPASRILAALALNTLESDKGDYAIARTAQFTDNQKVKHLCSWLAYAKKTGRSADARGMATLDPVEPLEEFGY